jgi:hypothetical protein
LTSSLVARGKSGNSNVENAGHMYVVPFLLVEGVNTIIHHQALVCFRSFLKQFTTEVSCKLLSRISLQDKQSPELYEMNKQNLETLLLMKRSSC